jgi:hypothetical protein
VAGERDRRGAGGMASLKIERERGREAEGEKYFHPSLCTKFMGGCLENKAKGRGFLCTRMKKNFHHFVVSEHPYCLKCLTWRENCCRNTDERLEFIYQTV